MRNGIFLAVGLYAVSAAGLTVGEYEVRFERADGRSGSLGITGGWSCESRIAAELAEGNRVDARGRALAVARTIPGISAASLLSGRSLSFGFQAETEGTGGTVLVTQECTHQRTVQRLSYRCAFPRFPAVTGERAKAACGIEAVAGTGPLTWLSDVPFAAEIALKATVEHYTEIRCAGGGKKVVIRLSQGVEGRPTEKDFFFTIRVDGGEALVLERREGILHDDILYCTNRDTVDVQVTALEKDLFFNDEYVGNPSDTVTLPLTGEGWIHLKRQRWTKATYHDVRVRVFGPARTASGPMLAEARTP